MHILYIAHYIDDNIIKRRKNKNMFFQSGMNKMNGIIKALNKNFEVTVLSPGYVKNKTFKFYKPFSIKKDNFVLSYASIIDMPFINMISCIISMIKNVKKINKNKKIDAVIFYNYRPETAIAAFYARIFLKLPILIEYEDGYFADKDIKVISKIIINVIESFMKKYINGAIVVNKNLCKRIKTNNCFTCIGIIDKIEKVEDHSNITPVIMYSGRYDYERGIEVFLESLQYINKPCVVNISGYGPLNDYVKKFIDNHEQLNKIIKINKFEFLSKEQLEEEFKNADIFVNPQRNESDFLKYSFPSKVIEYMKFGKIIISSNLNEIPNNAILKYYNDQPKQLADKINLVLNNISAYDNYKMKCVNYLKENCSIEYVSLELKNIIKKSILSMKIKE